MVFKQFWLGIDPVSPTQGPTLTLTRRQLGKRVVYSYTPLSNPGVQSNRILNPNSVCFWGLRFQFHKWQQHNENWRLLMLKTAVAFSFAQTIKLSDF